MNLATKTEQLPTNPIYEGFSNDVSLIEFYQEIPKFFSGDQNKLRIEGRFPTCLDREFTFDGKLFRAFIVPGRIEENENIIPYYAGEAEKQVEQAVWTLAYDYRKQYPDKFSNLFNFSANSIQAKLIRKGLNYSTADITKAIRILNVTNIEVQIKSGNTKASFDMFYPISFLEIIHGEIVTYGMSFNPYFMTSLNEGKFQPNAQGSVSG